MKMLQLSILDAIEEASISSRGDSLANPTQAQENEKEKKTNAIYGQKCLEQFEKLNPNGLWAKTFAALLIGMEGWYSTRCNLSWRLKGTKSSRFYFQLLASTHRTEEIESGLLLTPTAVMTDESPEKMRARAEKNGYKNGTKYGSLLSQVKYGMLPTPTAGDGMRGINANTTTFENGRFVRTSQTTGTKFGASLGQAAATGLLPTPQAIDGNGKGRPLRPKPGRKDYEKMGNWRGDLKDFATQGMLPTPRASGEECYQTRAQRIGHKGAMSYLESNVDYRVNYQMLSTPQAMEGEKITGKENQDSLTKRAREMTGKTSQLNPLFVEEMMGFPENWTALPFLSGETNPSRPTETQ